MTQDTGTGLSHTLHSFKEPEEKKTEEAEKSRVIHLGKSPKVNLVVADCESTDHYWIVRRKAAFPRVPNRRSIRDHDGSNSTSTKRFP